MRERSRAAVPATLLLALAGSGCILAGAGAGAGSGIYFTSRGVESVVAAEVGDVADATDRAFGHFGIERTELQVEGDGSRRTVRGKPADGDPEVTVTMQRESAGTTKVSVIARTGLVTWDKDYARGVIEKIVELATGEAPAADAATSAPEAGTPTAR